MVRGEENAGTRDGLWELKPTRPKLQVDTDPRAGVGLGTGSPEGLVLLRHVGIKKTGSREFQPSSSTSSLPLRPHTSVPAVLQDKPILVMSTISGAAQELQVSPFCVGLGDFLGAAVNLQLPGPGFSVPSDPYFRLQSA